MAERYARLEQFDCSDGDWKAYQERLEQLFVVNEVEANDEAGRRAALLTVCGRDAYNLLRTLCAPKKTVRRVLRKPLQEDGGAF